MTPAEQFDRRTCELGDWRGQLLVQLRRLVLAAGPNVVEEWKWDTLVWTHNGNICAVGAFKDHVGLNFFKGASLPDPQGLFNGGLQAKLTRSVNFYETNSLNTKALTDLVRAAIKLNQKQ